MAQAVSNFQVSKEEYEKMVAEAEANKDSQTLETIVGENSSLKTEIGIKAGGVYLITGGAGGLGQLFARHLAKTKGVQIILTGRSQLNKAQKEEVSGLKKVSGFKFQVERQNDLLFCA